MIKILLVEDMNILRETLSNTLNNENNIEVIASIDDASLALSMCEKYKPDLILMDICTSNGSNGINATKEIKKTFPNIKVVLMTGVPDITFINDAKNAHADGFIYKNISTNELINTIMQIIKGYTIYPNDYNFENNNFSLSELTKKEFNILKLFCEAKTRKEICEEIGITDGYLRSLISSILNKTGFDSMARLSIYVVANGLIYPN